MQTLKSLNKINIGGKQRPINFGVNQSILYCEVRGISITKMNKELTALENDSGAIIRDLMWSALKDGARKTKTEFSYSPYDIGDWLEDSKEETITEFITAMIGTLPKTDDKKSISTGSNVTPKKKVRKKTS